MASQPRLTFEAPNPVPTLAAVLKMAERLETIARDVAMLRDAVGRQRREIKDGVKRQHIAAIGALGGRCPCCGSATIIHPDGRKAQGAEFGHYYSASQPDAEHTWLICQPCHADLTVGRLPRDQREAEFRTYQNRGGGWSGRSGDCCKGGRRTRVTEHACLWWYARGRDHSRHN